MLLSFSNHAQLYLSSCLYLIYSFFFSLSLSLISCISTHKNKWIHICLQTATFTNQEEVYESFHRLGSDRTLTYQRKSRVGWLLMETRKKNTNTKQVMKRRRMVDSRRSGERKNSNRVWEKLRFMRFLKTMLVCWCCLLLLVPVPVLLLVVLVVVVVGVDWEEGMSWIGY